MSTENTEQTAATPPVKTKTAAGKIIAAIEAEPGKIIAFIGKEAGVIQKLFAAEAPVIQADLKAASAYVQVIKTKLNENPVIVGYLLRQVDVTKSEDWIKGVLVGAAPALKITIAPDADFAGVITAYLSAGSALVTELDGNNFWTGFFNVLGALISPGTSWAQIVTYGIYIYNTFIKPKV